MGCLERIELSISAPQAEVLPLNYRHHTFVFISINEEHMQVYLHNVRMPLIYGSPYTLKIENYKVLVPRGRLELPSLAAYAPQAYAYTKFRHLGVLRLYNLFNQFFYYFFSVKSDRTHLSADIFHCLGANIVKLAPASTRFFSYFNFIYHWREKRENSFNSDSGSNSPHGKSGASFSAMFPGQHCTLKSL